MSRVNTEKDFWSKTRLRRNGCIEWLGGQNGFGYGCVRFEGKIVSTHRLSWILTNGDIPKHDSFHGICVLHKCDNRLCVNPDHLFLGTQLDNVTDMYDKKRNKDSNGYITSTETRNKISTANKGQKRSEETKIKISNALKGTSNAKGRIVLQETRDKISKSNVGKTISEKQRQQISDVHKGKIVSEETKLKMSISQKRRQLMTKDNLKSHIAMNRVPKNISDLVWGAFQ